MRNKALLKNSLALRLLKVVFSIYLCITIVVTLIQMANEYVLEKNFIKNSLIISQNIFQNNLITSVWNFDKEQLFITVDAILKQPTIAGIQLFDENQQVLVQKGHILNNKSQPVLLVNDKQQALSYVNLFYHKFYLIHDKKNIGSVILYSSDKLVFDKVKYNFLLIIVNAIIKTIALWWLFIWAFNKFLTKQLDIFCRTMEKVDIDNAKESALILETFETYELSRIEYFFNKLLQRIIDSRDNLNELNKSLEQKVIERTQEIHSKNQKLEILNQEKNNFLAMAAHDLKNPLGNIKNLSSLIEKEINLNNDYGKILKYNEFIKISSNNMIDIVSNFLDVSKIESGNIEVKLESVDVLSLVNLVISENLPHAQKKNIVINLEADNYPYILITDRLMLLQILDNLVSNALKYSPLNSCVTIYILKQATAFQVMVKDQGPGFNLADKKNLFCKFCRLNNKPTANESSTGLGLFIVKKLTDALNMEIECDSVEGQGTIFRLQIPCQPS